MRNKLYLLLVLLVGIVQVGMAQEKTITGVVTDADDGSPLPGVSVVIKGTPLGPATDAMGFGVYLYRYADTGDTGKQPFCGQCQHAFGIDRY